MKLQLDSSNYDACPPYNDWLDEQYSAASGLLDILGYQPRPSRVLFVMSPDTYEAAFSDFLLQREEDIRETVLEAFPSLIAYYFYRFEHGYENELQRLHFLRDTWEAVVDVLHALAVAELRHRKLPLSEPLKFKNLLSDSVAQRLENIEEIAKQITAGGRRPEFQSILSPTTLATMRDLNQSRNAFSHGAAQSEAQALNWINECLDDVLDVLHDLEDLQNVLFLRYLNQPNATTLRCETFKGHSGAKTIKNFPLNSKQIADSSSYFQQDHLLVILGAEILSLRPIIHFRDDANGHQTRLCVLRKTHGDAPNRTIEYAVVGKAESHTVSRSVFTAELTEIRHLFGLGGD